MNNNTHTTFYRTGIFALMALMLLVSGCATPTQRIVYVPLPTNFVTPTVGEPQLAITPLPTATIIPTATILPTLTPTATPYAGVDFSKVAVAFGGFLSGYRYFIALRFPGDVVGQYYALVGSNSLEYTCEVMQEYPNRLYCTGPLAGVDKYVTIMLFSAETNDLVFTGQIFIPINS
jgi:hypothetical protein